MEIKNAINKVIEGRNLEEIEAFNVMGEIFKGNVTNSQIASLLTGLKMKGESISEIVGFARQMREFSLKINNKSSGLVDTCGTGGDCRNTFNISTTAAFIAAGAGVKIAKHGNRFSSSKCGSADVLEKLGVNLNISPEEVEKCIDEVGIGFLFAPNYHIAMKNVIVPRKEMGIRTIFNLLGPLTNPAGAEAQVLGVYSYEVAIVLAEALYSLGIKRALIVHGADGIDEITTTDKTYICELKEGNIKEYSIHPNDFGMQISKLEDLSGGTIEENASLLFSILSGEKGKKRDIAILNAAAAIYIAGLAADLKNAIEISKKSLDSGNALSVLNQFIDFTRRYNKCF